MRCALRTFVGVSIAWFVTAAILPVAAQAEIRDSVVKIFATRRAPDLGRPWRKQSPRDVSGSGVVIDGRRILTNAHVVLYASQVYVQAYQSSDKLAATVTAIAPGIDLALLEVDDESFFSDKPPLEMADGLPEVKDTASAYGYPVGGDSLSITRGIVSRIEFASYRYGETGLRIQVDAAINPGNSGGPMLVDDQVIGVVHALFPAGQNIGYVIPNEEIKMFLDDVADGAYDGKLRLFVGLQKLENDALRQKMKLPRSDTGILVRKTYGGDDADALRAGDVISKIGDYEIDNVGLVRVDENLRLRFEYLVPQLAEGDQVQLTVFRDGAPRQINVPVARDQDWVLRHLKNDYPSYFVYGPVVFATASRSYLEASQKLVGVMAFRNSPLVSRWTDITRFEGEQLVLVASSLLPHRISRGYSNPTSQVLTEVNGVEIKNIRHLVETLRDLEDTFVEFKFADQPSEVLVFDRQQLLSSGEDILSDNGIREQASADLRDVWNGGGE